MKFNKISINSKITDLKGIDEIQLNRLSNIIALVGKNGSGKTRILDLLEQNLFKNVNVLELIDNTVTGLPKSIKNSADLLYPALPYLRNLRLISELREELKKAPKNHELSLKIDNLLRQNKRLIRTEDANIVHNLVNQIQAELPPLKGKFLRRIKHEEIQQLQDAINDTSNDTITFENLIEMVTDNNPYDEFKLIHKSGLKFLSRLPHQLAYDQYECLVNKKKIEDRVSYKRFQSLKKLVENFLKKDLTWEQKMLKGNLTDKGNDVTFIGVWKIEGRDFDYNEFSNGEKSLFAYALLLFLIDQNPNLNIKESIILVDEPELHLHPESEIDLINGLRTAIGENGQLIFATHSINILSHLNYDEIFMVKNGKINHPSQSNVSASLSQLMGIEDRINKLSDFLSSISTWTFVNFMSECFTNPEVIETANPNDPQVEAFKKAIEKNGDTKSNVLLDFGAGKGRIFEQLKSDYDFFQKISYSALEPDNNLHTQLKKIGVNQIFKNHNELPKNSFDFILLCNVLHEIPIKDWMIVLNKIIQSLTQNGFLVIIEAKILTKGEKIGKEGFILLDIEELKSLFGLKTLPSEIKISGKEETVTCALFPKNKLRQIKKVDILKTLVDLEKNTFEKIISLRNSAESDPVTIGLGRKNAFLSQLYINSKIAQINLSNQN
ncbi:AAA family ATPase [Flavobacterium sp. UW10123]|uniref:AAA family ATPase n=1 Tax=Flavobacterium sp. UW10123 TaxID=3230800 RepID=UPI00339725BF